MMDYNINVNITIMNIKNVQINIKKCTQGRRVTLASTTTCCAAAVQEYYNYL